MVQQRYYGDLRRDPNRGTFWRPAVMVILFLLGFATFVLICSYFEAQSYNRVTGSDVSTWDAIWLELRVQEGTE